MGKLEEMARKVGAHVGESMGEFRSAASVHRAPPSPHFGVPARFQGVAKAQNAAEIPVAKIERDPEQPREEFDDNTLAQLADSIKARGVLQPIRVRWDEAKGVYVIIAGERRWRAAGMAGLATLPCVVDDRQMSPAERLSIQLIENALREDLKPIEQAKAYKALMDANDWSIRQLAADLKIDHTKAVRALAMLELPESVQAHVEQGDLPPATAYEISKLKDPAKQAELASRVVSEKLSRDKTADVVHRSPGRSTKGKAKAKDPKKTSRTFKVDGYRIVAENRRGIDPKTLVTAFEALVQELRSESDA